MKRIKSLAAMMAAVALLPLAAAAQSDETGMRGQFAAIVDELNANSFLKFHEAVDDEAFVNRIFGTRVVDDDARRAFAQSFASNLEKMFQSSFPAARTEEEAAGEIIGTIVSFEEEGNKARAIVRYAGEGFRYTWHAYDLERGRGGVRIVDWFDYYQSGWFSEIAGDSLVRTMPSPAAVKSVLETPSPTRGQLFQVGELFKAVRDGNPRRYVEIYDGLEETLRQEPFIVEQNFKYWRFVRDPGRLRAAATALAETFPGDARYSLGLAEFYVQSRRFDDAIAEFDRLESALGTEDAVIRSLEATAAMALGNFDEAESKALSATEAEPALELAWWTLLRTRTAQENYAGAVEAMSVLEDRFRHLLTPQQLRRDRFLKVLIDQEEYKDWRAARDQA